MWGSSDGRFFRSHSWRGRLRPVFRVRPIPLSFWGNVPPLQWGALFRMAHSPPITSLSPHFYGLLVVRYSLRFPLRTFRARLTSKAISIFNFQGPPGCGSRSLSEVGRCRDNSVSYFRAKVYGLVVQVTHPLSPYIVYNSPKKQKIPPEKQNLRFALRRDVFRHDC